ncbi:MAG: hypothetical protein LBG19_04370 [Prevotellaceae bacterium]|nr:hypothetical protein [Prevotellaceae bacterium]
MVTSYKEALKETFKLHNTTDESGRHYMRSQEALINAIGEDFFHQFSVMGFIKRGVVVNERSPIPTWSMTQAGINEYNFYFSKPNPSDQDLELARLLVDLGA